MRERRDRGRGWCVLAAHPIGRQEPSAVSASASRQKSCNSTLTRRIPLHRTLRNKGEGMEVERRLLGRWDLVEASRPSRQSHVNLSGVKCEMGRGSGRGVCERNRRGANASDPGFLLLAVRRGGEKVTHRPRCHFTVLHKSVLMRLQE